MRVVIQRVKRASVSINNEMYSSIQQGILVLVGIEELDNFEDIDYLCGKISKLRIFDDENEIMNLSVSDIKAEMLVVSQFTLHASTKKGNRPSYIRAARLVIAIPLYEKFIEKLKSESGLNVKTGKFGEMMQVELINDGPVTIIIDTKNKE
ncbi:MAG: D-tyrosyl-tRNA(Tyr) deacylase [Bacteroidetes bacterium GWA2_30_7]|nr:MAG: D-tyrosyl-tRNA(Tyr) deacylase [Bacteroidetes bacterium GWA2_30_7]